MIKKSRIVHGGVPLGFLLAFVVLLLTLGIIEKIKHDDNLEKLPVRVNINGTRGKSTVTRLITGIFVEAGIKVVGKTTGTSARVIYWNREEERPLARSPLGPNIIEQISVAREAVALGGEAFVTECMAVNPDYQLIFQNKLVKANIGVIVNVREDHLDLCGPTLDQIAESFLSTIPFNGHLIISNSEYNEYFTQEATRRNTRTIIADESKISEDYLKKFRYILFPENVALALAVAEAMEIDEETAFRGMLKAKADPGALQILSIGEKQPAYFVNAFAANDPNSTLMIWNYIADIGYPVENPIIVLNCREDRVDRTIQYAEDVLPYIDIDTLIVIGNRIRPIIDAVEKGRITARHFYKFEGYSTKEAFEKISDLLAGRVVFGVGNIHGAGEEFVELITEYSLKQAEGASA